MSSNYFNALMRSAGMAPKASAPVPSAPTAAAASEVFDPFEAAESIDAVAPTERGDAPTPLAPMATPTRPQAMPATPMPVQAQEALPAVLAHDAHPAVQAALRWVTAGVALGTEPVSPPSAPEVAELPSGHPTLDPVQAQVRPADPPITMRVDHVVPKPAWPGGSVAAPTPEPRIERQATTDSEPVAPPKPRALTPSVSAQPDRPPQVELAERASSSSRTEVHIGTLHVTLDAAATARFATRTMAPPAPEAVRASPPSSAHQPSRQSADSSLSRSRLPRW
jgi:hypothetical protein